MSNYDFDFFFKLFFYVCINYGGLVMKISQQLKIKQNQSLIMTPQLQQAIKLLQLSNLELSEFVENARAENPFIKDETSSKSTKVTEKKEMTQDLLIDPNKAEGSLKPEKKIEMENCFDSHISQNGSDIAENYYKKSNNLSEKNYSTTEIIENTHENKISLQQYLINQINLQFEHKFVGTAIALTDYLHPSGWMITPLEKISSELNIEISFAETILKKLQTLEPTGIFATSLSNCLKIQLEDIGLFNSSFEILLNNLSLLTKGKIRQLSKMSGVSNDKIIEMVNIVKTLNPKPAEGFLDQELNISQPDVMVIRTEKGWKIDLNRSTLPSINLDEDYINEINQVNLDESSNLFTTEKIGEAKWIKKAVEQRNKTILRVTSEILKKQTAFFKHGFSHMKPMILKDIADSIGMHESTISRVTNSKLILTEWGLLSMKDFFSASISSTEESDKHAASAVREALKKLISNEISGKPLSDERIALVLCKDGMDVARRTVAKYRDMLNIPSSAERKRNAKFNKLLSNG